MKPLPFNDEWIIANSDRFNSFRGLAEAHNEKFGTDFSRTQMKNHAGLGLGIRMNHYYYTDEMKEWIRQEYPKAGSSDEKAKLFNARFNTNRKGHSIREMARRLGVTLSEDALETYKHKSADWVIHHNQTVKAKPIGYVGRKSNGYLMVKTEAGWISQARYEYLKTHDDIPKGYVVIFLDGNNKNISAENLMAIPQRWQPVMSVNGFWSEHPMITRTGLTWCKLNEMLQKGATNDI